jgi:hypothetical protein
MRFSLEQIDASDVAVFLPCWKRSEGARTEREYCRRTAKPFLDFEDEAASLQCLLRLRPVLAARHAYDEQLNDLLRFALNPDPQTNGLGREAAQKLPIATKALLHATREAGKVGGGDGEYSHRLCLEYDNALVYDESTTRCA